MHFTAYCFQRRARELAIQSAAARHCPPAEVRVVMSEVTGVRTQLHSLHAPTYVYTNTRTREDECHMARFVNVSECLCS